MQPKFLSLSCLSFLIIFIGCGGGGNSDSNKLLYNQIMNIHDEIMPETGKINSIRNQLKSQLDSATTDLEKELLLDEINHIDSVDRMMMDWEHEFKAQPDTVDEEKARKYYETHLERAKKVREAVLSVVNEGTN